MEKQKPWQFWLIAAVIILTLYNILPTVFYYSKPLHDPIDQQRSQEVAAHVVNRVNDMEQDATAWLASFSKLIGVQPLSIELQTNEPRLIKVTFKDATDAVQFKKFLPEAGSLISFVPAQLQLNPEREGQMPNEVYVSRQIDVHLNPGELGQLFQFSMKNNAENKPETLYRNIIQDRAAEIATAFGSPSRLNVLIENVINNPQDANADEMVINSAKELVDGSRLLEAYPALYTRWLANVAQGSSAQGDALMQKYSIRLEAVQNRIKPQLEALQTQASKNVEEGNLTGAQNEQIKQLNSDLVALNNAIKLIKDKKAAFAKASKPLSRQMLQKQFAKGAEKQESLQRISLLGTDPFIQAIVIDWNADKIYVEFYKDVQALLSMGSNKDADAFVKEKLNNMLYDDIARASSLSDEAILPDGDSYAVKLNTLANSQSFLTLDLGHIAQTKSKQIEDQLLQSWVPQHSDLVRDAYPVMDWNSHQQLPASKQRLGLVVYAPATYDAAPPEGFSSNSIYVIAKGLGSILQKYKDNPQAAGAEQFSTDVRELNQILQQYGFIGFQGNTFGLDPIYRNDYIFKLDNYYNDLLKATREDFVAKGSKRYAVLDFTDVEQRILTENRIEDRMQEDLLKWGEEYNAAQVDLNHAKRYLVPPPTKNAYWENFKISFAKYFRGDDRKILKWGLDLSGGKTVRIGLKDSSGKAVTNPEDLAQAANELYNRVNTMGVSERTIRVENNNIVLDFPGSQNLSANELVKASTMYFHIVNEKFTPYTPGIGSAVNQFLLEVWNEAVVTNRKDTESINEIAYRHLGEDLSGGDSVVQPRSEAAQTLYNAGLRLVNPKEYSPTSNFNDTLSTIGVMRGDSYTEWMGQQHPLEVMFANYALEGSNLTDVVPGFDQQSGNILSFKVKKSSDKGSGTPRDDFYNWTSQFSEDRIAGTPKEAYTKGKGWRMAIVLNGRIISAPSLNAAIRDAGTISGRFSQRDINKLAADLKAGSLSFTPRILSEENVSPELGKEERNKGIMASLIALALVVISMISYYRFAGLVASCAVLFNILIMWGVLQNLGAALTLPGIAGIVLTIAMAIDANVLVFERFREEFKISGRVGSALATAYRKAFSAIIDSNITTIIVALILIQFDSGPIKGFAVTIIIGIISSMFTALFMTRYYFAGWVQNPKHKELKMAELISGTNYDFIAQTKKAIILSLLVIAVGLGFFVEQRNTIFGMDFTGGYSLTTEVQEKPGVTDYRLQAIDALLAQGATVNDFQVRELSYPQQLRIQLGMGMEENGHPFYGMPLETDNKVAYPYQNNPRIEWIVNALKQGGIEISPSELPTLDQQWTVMSGQFSSSMRNNAIIGMVLALLAILAYITIRFEFKFAIAAVVGLLHDVLITLGIIALFHKLGFPVNIDLQTVGALMMIIGYSLNDTIIVFDRIREDTVLMRKRPFREIVNHAINVTLSRTIMTSGTTILVLLALVLFGGASLFGFSLVMTIGVIVGTLSSLFIASPVMLYFHNKEHEAERLSLAQKHS